MSTRKLVDSDEEQRLLEELIEGQKPSVPMDEGFHGLHYLLFTPFRHPPLRRGSRFGHRTERGIFYAAEGLRTAFAEVAYYRLVFLEGTAAELDPLLVEVTAFKVLLDTGRAADLASPPFDAHQEAISSPVSYEVTQSLGSEMRADGVTLFRYPSARDPGGGVNVGVFTPQVFGARRPRGLSTWLCVATRSDVELSRRDFFHRGLFSFTRSQFEVEGRLPAPAT